MDRSSSWRGERTGSEGAGFIINIGLDLLRRDINHVPILVLCHLTQELLKFPTAIFTHFALKLGKSFIYRLGCGHRMLDISLYPNDSGESLYPNDSGEIAEIALHRTN